MRTETDVFEDVDGIAAQVSADETMSGSVFIRCNDIVELTKDQAREFARQLLELCGDE